jgi:hypothetical protein
MISVHPSPTLCLPKHDECSPRDSWFSYGAGVETCMSGHYSWAHDTQHLLVPSWICLRYASRDCLQARKVGLTVQNSGLRGQLRWGILKAGRGSSVSYVQKVSTSCIVSENVSQFTCSHLRDENVGHMGKEPANTCIPHRVDYCIVLALIMRHIKLTRMVHG